LTRVLLSGLVGLRKAAIDGRASVGRVRRHVGILHHPESLIRVVNAAWTGPAAPARRSTGSTSGRGSSIAWSAVWSDRSSCRSRPHTGDVHRTVAVCRSPRRARKRGQVLFRRNQGWGSWYQQNEGLSVAAWLRADPTGDPARTGRSRTATVKTIGGRAVQASSTSMS